MTDPLHKPVPQDATVLPPVPNPLISSDPEAEGPLALELGSHLPVGFMQKGQVFREFTIRPPRGALRREYANSASAGPAKARMVALRHILKSLGPLDPLPANADILLRKIPAPDADFIDFFATYTSCGQHLRWAEPCEACGGENQLTADMHSVRVSPGTTEVLFDDNGRPYQEMTYADPALRRNVVVSFYVPTMADQIRLLEKYRPETAGDFAFEQMARLMCKFDGGAPKTVLQLDDLNISSLDALMEVQRLHSVPVIDTEVKFKCCDCGSEEVAFLPTTKWLDPFVNQGR